MDKRALKGRHHHELIASKEHARIAAYFIVIEIASTQMFLDSLTTTYHITKIRHKSHDPLTDRHGFGLDY